MSKFTQKQTPVAALLVLLFYALILNLPYIDLREFQGEEGRRIVIAANMVTSGDWLVPSVEGTVYMNKPPFYNWLLAIFFKLTASISETTARIPSVAAAFLSALVLSVFYRKTCNVQTAWFILPGLVFLTFPDVMDKAIRAEIDMTFTLIITISLLSWFYYHEICGRPAAAWTISLFCVGLGVLTKGIQAPAFFYCGVIPYLIYTRRWKGLFSPFHGIGLTILAGIFFLWFIPFSKETGTDRVLHTWWTEIAVRTKPLGDSGGFFSHLARFPLEYFAAYAPWLFFLFLWSKSDAVPEMDNARKVALFCSLCLLFSVPVYWLMPGARLRYILPLACTLSLLVTIPLHLLVEEKRLEPLWVKSLFRVTGVLMVVAVLSFPFWGGRFKIFVAFSSLIFISGTFLSGCILALGKGFLRQRVIFLIVALLTVKLLWASLYFPYHEKYLSHSRKAAEAINAILPGDARLFDYAINNAHLAFYLGRPVKLISKHDVPSLKAGDYILTKKERAGEFNSSELTFVLDIKARGEVLALYRR